MCAASNIDNLWTGVQIHQAGRCVADVFDVNEVTRDCSVTEDNDWLAAEAMFKSCPDNSLSSRPGLAGTIRIGNSQNSYGHRIQGSVSKYESLSGEPRDAVDAQWSGRGVFRNRKRVGSPIDGSARRQEGQRDAGTPSQLVDELEKRLQDQRQIELRLLLGLPRHERAQGEDDVTDVRSASASVAVTPASPMTNSASFVSCSTAPEGAAESALSRDFPGQEGS